VSTVRKGISHNARSAFFAPLDQTGREAAVTHRLVDGISLGLLADAEQLPSEVELATQFGVSTVTIREALASLREQGLVETRRGRTKRREFRPLEALLAEAGTARAADLVKLRPQVIKVIGGLVVGAGSSARPTCWPTRNSA
jgi:DNA-binding transcriptional MocR family regulator